MQHLEEKYLHRLEELRLEAFTALAAFVDRFVEKHWGDQPQLVQYSLMLEFLESITSMSVIKNIDLSMLIQLMTQMYNKYKNELHESSIEKGET